MFPPLFILTPLTFSSFPCIINVNAKSANLSLLTTTSSARGGHTPQWPPQFLPVS